ncbi:MAG: hypothetical protein ACD_23C00950G0001 [uncultured bacterium]|nr:MAG: hypothetical protein ACD_23C00950G0001 [uncultured bacterium]
MHKDPLEPYTTSSLPVAQFVPDQTPFVAFGKVPIPDGHGWAKRSSVPGASKARHCSVYGHLDQDDDCNYHTTSNLHAGPEFDHAVIGKAKEVRHTACVAGHDGKQGFTPVGHAGAFGRHHNFPTEEI